MRTIKNVCRDVFRSVGFELNRVEKDRVRFDNFLNLARAYERRLNESEPIITANEMRPRLLARLLGTVPSEAYAIVQALARTRAVRGSVCEFGVAQGETTALIANELLSGEKTLHLFDSFQGLPPPTEQDRLKNDIFSLGSMAAYAGTMSCPEAMVRARLKAVSFPAERYVVHAGFIDRVLRDDTALPGEVSFAYVDFDLYEPIRRALEFLHEVMPAGAMVIVDDYDFFSTGAKTAVDEFIAARNRNTVLYECSVPDTVYGYFAVLTKKGDTR